MYVFNICAFISNKKKRWSWDYEALKIYPGGGGGGRGHYLTWASLETKAH
jgi:hypothetical protein